MWCCSLGERGEDRDFKAADRIGLASKQVNVGVRPTLLGDRNRKIPDRNLAVFDLAKSFSIRNQKLIKKKIRLGFYCAVSSVPAMGIT